MVKCTVTEACVVVGMYGIILPTPNAHFTGAKRRVHCLLKPAKVYLCSSGRMSHLKQDCGYTHMHSK